MDTALATAQDQAADMIEQVVVEGDLSKMTPGQRVQYYARVCESTGLNPFTKPFEYIKLNGKLTLYARKDATDQLRRLHSVSLDPPQVAYQDDMVIVTIQGHAGERTDTEIGAVSLAGLKGENRANGIMKAHTKAKRRLTLSLCGLGWLDETEIETIPTAQRVQVNAETGEVVEGQVREPFTGNGWESFFVKACEYFALTREQAVGYMGDEADYVGLDAGEKSKLAKERIGDGVTTDLDAAVAAQFEKPEEPAADEKLPL